MATWLIDKIKPKDNAGFALVDAADIEMPNGDRLDAYLEAQKTAAEATVGVFAKEVADLKVKDAEVAAHIAELVEKDKDIVAAATALTEQVGDNLDELAKRAGALEERLDDMDYGDGIVIESFTHDIGTKERGEVVKSLTLSWKLDRTPVTLTLDGVAVENDGSEPKTGLNITAGNQDDYRWTLVATDNRNKVVRQTSPGFTFLNCVYYGMAEDPGAGNMTSGFIRALKTKTSPTKYKNRTITYTGDGTYMWYCLPVSLGKVTFTCDGFPSPFELVESGFEFENWLGYKEPYYVYRSKNRNSKTLTMVVT